MASRGLMAGTTNRRLRSCIRQCSIDIVIFYFVKCL
jgi:hypothetical protein